MTDRKALIVKYAKELLPIQNHPLNNHRDITTFLGFCDTEAEMVQYVKAQKTSLDEAIARYEAENELKARAKKEKARAKRLAKKLAKSTKAA